MKTIIKFQESQQNATFAFVAVFAVLLLIFMALFGVYEMRRKAMIAQVRDALMDIASDMEEIRVGGDGYPVTAPIKDIANYNKVSISGGSSYNGLSYCIDATSKANKSVVYYVDSNNNQNEPIKGSCGTRSDTSLLLAPGGIAVAFANSNEVKLIWDKDPYATSYKLECSSGPDFSSPIAYIVDNNTGLCDNLDQNTKYYFRVKSINSADESDWSSIVQTNTYGLSVNN